MRRTLMVVMSLLLAASHARSAQATVIVDGTRDASYAAPYAVQTTQTGGNDAGLPNSSGEVFGSELDAAFARFEGDTLHLMFTGNWFARFSGTGPVSYFDRLWVFFETGVGGQDSVRADAPLPLGDLAGLKFDQGFHPGHAFEAHVAVVNRTLDYYHCTLPSAGAGTGVWLGSTSMQSHAVTIETSDNTFHIVAAVNDSNAAGVSAGCGAASGAGVDHGIEMRIPLAALGQVGNCLKVSAFIQVKGQHILATSSLPNLTVINQSLPPMPPGTCNPGQPAGVDFGAIPGPQYETLCRPGSGVEPGAPSSFALSAPRPTPANADVQLTLSLAKPGHVSCRVVDALGRLVARLADGEFAAGEHTLRWGGISDAGARVPAGVYFIQADRQGEQLVRRAVLMGGH